MLDGESPVSCAARLPVWELAGARVGREHSKLQDKQCVAKNGRRPETMQSRAEQCLAESVKLCLPAGSVTLLGEW